MSATPAGLFRAPAATLSATSGTAIGLPTRSEIDGWTRAIDDLSSAAEAFGAAAERLETAADAHARQLSAPGGTDWEGDAANTAEQRAYADRAVIYAAADLVRRMRKVANLGAGNLQRARNAALEAIAEAETDEFRVNEELTVTDTRRYTGDQVAAHAARQVIAETHHGYIAMRASQLAADDMQVGAELAAGATELDGMVPSDWLNNEPALRPASTGDGEVQTYDNDTVEEDDALSGQQVADRLRELRRGLNRGISEVDTEDEIFDLYEELTRGGDPLPTPDNYYDRRVLPDGTIIGVRESADHGPTLDVKYPPGVTGPDKIHLPPPPPPPPTPPTPGEAPVIASPPNLPVVDHPPVPGLLPPWAQAPAGIPQGPLPYGGLPPGVGVATPELPPLAPSAPGSDWIPTPSLPAAPTPEEQVGIGGILFGGLLAFLGWLGAPKVSY